VAERAVSVLVVNFNGAAHLAACLTALGRQSIPRDDFEVVVVDNASTDGSVQLVRSQFPWARLVVSDRNTGFAEGNNLARDHARGSRLALLNNDTIPDPFWLEELLRVADRHPPAWIASKLVFVHDPAVINTTGLILLRDGRGADRGFRQPDCGQYEAGGPVFAGCAAAILLPAPPRSEPIFDARYFFYYEDLDAQWRHRLRGGTVIYAPRAVVRHVHGAAAGDRSPLFHYHVERNRALTALRNADPVLAAWTAGVLFAKVGRTAVRALAGAERWAVAKAVAGGAADYLRLAPRVLAERAAARAE
jgi:GT2 family glycosyltransferase